MNKKLLTLMVSGLLLGVSPLYAQDSNLTGFKAHVANIFSMLNNSQRDEVKKYMSQHATEHKAAVVQLRHDASGAYNLVIAKNIDQKQLNSVTSNLANDQAHLHVMQIEILNYIYNTVATDAQRPEIQKELKAALASPPQHVWKDMLEGQ